MDLVWIYVPMLLLLLAWTPLVVARRPDKAYDRRLAAIERRLQLVMDHLGVVEPVPDLPEVVREVDQGRKIEAIKAYREATGVGLKEAKDAVEEIARARGR